MLVKFTSKNATVYDKDRANMEKKLESRLSRYFDAEPEVFVKITETKLGFKVEITLPYYGYQLRAESSTNDGLYAAFDDAVDVIEKRMTKHKDKIISRKAKGSVSEPVVPVPSEEDLPDDMKLVRVKRFEIKPMTTSEAILNMEMLGHDFFVFYSADEKTVCTLYKRKDGGYGMVVPSEG